MFRELVEQQRAVFVAKQSDLIDAMGGKFQDLIRGMPRIPEMIFGPPPYIVDDGERALLLIDGDGKYLRLPADFRLSEESVNEDHSALYSIPLLNSGGLVRFIPANQDYDFQDVSSEIATAADDSFFPPVDRAFEMYINSVMSLTKVYVTEKLIEIMRPLMQCASETELTIAEFMGSKELLAPLFLVFEESLVKASGRVKDIATSSDEQCPFPTDVPNGVA
jgi:hypothetical protein